MIVPTSKPRILRVGESYYQGSYKSVLPLLQWLCHSDARQVSDLPKRGPLI
jgi:hypothetical protein